MLRIETKGTWKQMGQQIGEEFRDLFEPCITRACAWLRTDLNKYMPAISSTIALLKEHCSELIDETEGMAEGAQLDFNVMLGYRFRSLLNNISDVGCSAICVVDCDTGPLICFNCDLNPMDKDFQVLRICRPNEGMATIGCEWLGLAGGYGFNECGLGFSGASSHTDAKYGDKGFPMLILQYLALHRCKSVGEVSEMLSKHTALGKPLNYLVCDKSGDSMLCEIASGMSALQFRREAGESWQGCTNFFKSGQIPNQPRPDYLSSAYARYGRMVHQVEGGHMEHSVDGLKQLLGDLAQPGLCEPERDNMLHTAYSFVMDLKGLKMHLCPGNPAKLPYEEIAL